MERRYLSRIQSQVDEIMHESGIQYHSDEYWSIWNFVYCAIVSWIPSGLVSGNREAYLYVLDHWEWGHAGWERYETMCVGESR